MVSRYISPNLAPAFRLKALLGDKWHTLNPGEHPLGVGRLALDKYLAGLSPLSDHERVAMADVKRWAEIIDKASCTWRPHERWFVKDLLTATRCRSLLFEVEVIIGCVDSTVRGYEWPIYREGERDIQTQGPDMVIECKITNSTEIGRVLKRTSKARRQGRPEGLPLVAAVGFDRILTPEEVGNVAEEVRGQQGWFLARPDLAAALIVMRTTVAPDGVDWNPLGFRGSVTYYGELLEIRNFGSAVSLPEAFSFGGVEGLARIQRQRRLMATTTKGKDRETTEMMRQGRFTEGHSCHSERRPRPYGEPASAAKNLGRGQPPFSPRATRQEQPAKRENAKQTPRLR